MILTYDISTTRSSGHFFVFELGWFQWVHGFFHDFDHSICRCWVVPRRVLVRCVLHEAAFCHSVRAPVVAHAPRPAPRHEPLRRGAHLLREEGLQRELRARGVHGVHLLLGADQHLRAAPLLLHGVRPAVHRELLPAAPLLHNRVVRDLAVRTGLQRNRLRI